MEVRVQEPRCKFCDRPHDLVGKLIAGPGVFICDQCVFLCVDILQGTESPLGVRPDARASLMSGGRFHWHPVGRTTGIGLDELDHGLTEAFKWLRDREIDPRSLGPDDIRFAHPDAAGSNGLEILLRVEAIANELPVVFADNALGRDFIMRYGENLLFGSTSISMACSDGVARISTECHALFQGAGHVTNWTHCGDLEEGFRGVIAGVDSAAVASVHLFRHRSKEPERLRIRNVGSRIGIGCVATLIDESGAVLEILDSDSKVVGREHIGDRMSVERNIGRTPC